MTSQDLQQEANQEIMRDCGGGKKVVVGGGEGFKIWILEKLRADQLPHQRNEQKTT